MGPCPAIVPCPVVCPSPPSAPDYIMSAVVELCVAVLLVDAAFSGHKRGAWRWVSTLLGGIIFGWSLEWANTNHGGAGAAYCYPPAPFPFNLGGVPLWVPIGWGGIIYAATWTAKHLQLNVVARAAAAAFLVASIDFSLDPVAKLLGFWVWECDNVNFFGVPYDNFDGWYLIVFVYALTASLLLGCTRHLWDKKKAGASYQPWLGVLVQLAAPVACAIVAILVLLLAKSAVPAITKLITTVLVALFHHPPDPSAPSAVLFVLLTAAGAGTLLFSKPRPRDPVAPNWPIIAVPVVIHVASYWLFLQYAGMAAEPSLVATIPLQLLAGIFVYTLPWRRRRLLAVP
ncbi:MAG TPA: carotenoid biosynthesis protein [Polyangiaceae bacterium]